MGDAFMRSRLLIKLTPVVLAIAIALSGCAGKTASRNGTEETTSNRPPLAVPKAFDDTSAKRAFALQAIMDGYYAEAHQLLEQTAKEDPTAESYQILGTGRYNVQDLAGAMEAWRTAMELNPNLTGEMLNNVGNALRDQGKIDEALSHYRNALQTEPTRWTAAINMAMVLKVDGHLTEAIAELESAASANKEVTQLTSLLKDFKEELASSQKDNG